MHICECCVWFYPRWLLNVTRREEQLRSRSWPWHTTLFSKCTRRKAAQGRCQCSWASVTLWGQTPWAWGGWDSHHSCGTRPETLENSAGGMSLCVCGWQKRFKKLEGITLEDPRHCSLWGVVEGLSRWNWPLQCWPSLVVWEKSNRVCIMSRGFKSLDIDQRTYAISSAQLWLIPLHIHSTKEKEWWCALGKKSC